MKKLAFVAAVAILGASAVAVASGRMQPGMWDYTMKMDMPGMPMQMPPQTYQHCLSQSDIDQQKQFKGDRQKDCEVKNLKQAADSASFDMSCKDGATGHADYTFGGDTMTGKTVMTMKEGRTVTMNMSAKRSGDCK